MSCQFNLPIQKQTTPCGWNNPVAEILQNSDEIKIFPNPFNSTLNISFNRNIQEKVRIRVVNILGEEVYTTLIVEGVVHNKTFEINNLSLKEGIYFLLIDGATFSFNKKIICTK
jgi:hypothetical protein